MAKVSRQEAPIRRTGQPVHVCTATDSCPQCAPIRQGGWSFSRVARLGLSFACCWHSVIWPSGLRLVSVEPLGPGLAQLPGSSLAGRCPMTTAAPSTVLATIQPVFTDAERVALAGFLAGYRGLTREAYALDLRQFASWCRARSVALFAVRRTDIESFARELEAMGRARTTVTRRLSTIAGFYKYAVEEELLDRSPAAHVRRPRGPATRTETTQPDEDRRPVGRSRPAPRACPAGRRGTRRPG